MGRVGASAGYGSVTENITSGPVSSIYKALEKVLLDPIFMILKCEYFHSLWIVFVKLHDVSTSHLEALVT